MGSWLLDIPFIVILISMGNEHPFAQHCRRSLRGGVIIGLAYKGRLCVLDRSSDAYMATALVTFFCRCTYMEIAEHIVKRKHIYILMVPPGFSPNLSIPFYSTASIQATS